VTRYLGRRVLLAVPTAAGILVAVFAIAHLAPGDAASALARGGRRVPPAAAAELRRIYGLDRPLPEQLWNWTRRAVRFDFGRSFQDGRPVAERIREALPFTLALNGCALVLTLLLGIPIGVAQARRAGRAFDRIVDGVLFALYSMPSFWIAMLLLALFSVRLGWLPLFGASSDLPASAGVVARGLDRARHALLPVLCLTYVSLAFFARMVRSSVAAEIPKEYVVAVRARGASWTRAIWGHALRNALLPLLTVVGLMIPGLLSGSVLIEQIFAWPGLGRLFYGAILARDYPVILALSTLTALLTLASILATDLLYAAADPRIRRG